MRFGSGALQISMSGTSRTRTSTFPGFIRSNDSTVYGCYCVSFYYTIAPSLPINKSCESYVGFALPEDRVFWRGDLFVVRYEGELGTRWIRNSTSVVLRSN